MKPPWLRRTSFPSLLLFLQTPSFYFLSLLPPPPSHSISHRSSAPSTSLSLLSWRHCTLELSPLTLPSNWVARSPVATTEALIMQFKGGLPWLCHGQRVLFFWLFNLRHTIDKANLSTHTHASHGPADHRNLQKGLYAVMGIFKNKMAAIWQPAVHGEVSLHIT